MDKQMDVMQTSSFVNMLDTYRQEAPFSTIAVGNGIHFHYPKSFKMPDDIRTTIRYDVDRMEVCAGMNWINHEQLITDFFNISEGPCKNASEKRRNKKKKKRVTRGICFGTKDTISCRVYIPDENSSRHEYFHTAYVLSNGYWDAVNAHLVQGNIIEFPVTKIEAFALTARPAPEKMTIFKHGLHYKLSDSISEIKFASNCVRENTPVEIHKIKVYPEIIRQRVQRGVTSLIAMTDSVYIQHGKETNVSGVMEIILAMDRSRTNVVDTRRYKLVSLHWTGDAIQITDVDSSSYKQLADGRISVNVSSFTGNGAAWMDRNSGIENATLEVRLASKHLTECQILSFYKDTKNRNKKYLWLECVHSDSVENVVEKRRRENGLVEIPNSRSQMIYLASGHRIRIYLRGSLKCNYDALKGKCFFIFIEASTDIHVYFPVVFERHASRFGYGIISFRLHTCSKVLYGRNNTANENVLHKIEFDPNTKRADTKTNNVHVMHEQLSRSQTLSSIIYPLDPRQRRPTKAYQRNKPLQVQPRRVDEFLGDKSINSLAKHISMEDARNLTFELNISGARIGDIRSQYSNQTEIKFELLKEWIKCSPPGTDRLKKQLFEALSAVGAHHVAGIVSTACREKRALKDSDFR